MDAGWNGYENEVPHLGCVGVVLGKGVQPTPPHRRDGDTVASREWMNPDPKKTCKPQRAESNNEIDKKERGNPFLYLQADAEDSNETDEQIQHITEKVNLADLIKKPEEKT